MLWQSAEFTQAGVATQRKQLAGGVIRAGYEMRSEGIRITDAKLAIRAA
jgi:hypothetical protein